MAGQHCPTDNKTRTAFSYSPSYNQCTTLGNPGPKLSEAVGIGTKSQETMITPIARTAPTAQEAG
jgi:hypothetical protein